MNSTNSTRRFGWWMLALSICGLVAAPSTADWLVLQDGERIETRGPWEVKGSRLQFTDSKGSLVSMRVSDVDLEASRLATQPQAAQSSPTQPAKSAAPARRPAPVLVLDNTTVRQARPSTIAAANGETDPETPEPNAEKLRIVSYEEDRGYRDGVRFRGVLENPSDNFAVLVSVRGVLKDTTGQQSATAEGTLPAKSVGPGETQTFVVEFANSWAYSSVDFEVGAKFLKSGREAEETPSTESSANEEDSSDTSQDSSATDNSPDSSSSASAPPA